MLWIQLPSTLVFDYPTINAIAEFAASQAHTNSGSTTAANTTSTVQHSASLTRAVSMPSSNSNPEAIAVTAVSARLPALPSAAEMVTGLADCSRVIPGDRWSADLQLTADMPARFGMFVEGAYMFDAEAFATTEAEAVLLDPQQRLLLECTYEVSWSQHDVATADSFTGSIGAGMFRLEALLHALPKSMSKSQYARLTHRLVATCVTNA